MQHARAYPLARLALQDMGSTTVCVRSVPVAPSSPAALVQVSRLTPSFTHISRLSYHLCNLHKLVHVSILQHRLWTRQQSVCYMSSWQISHTHLLCKYSLISSICSQQLIACPVHCATCTSLSTCQSCNAGYGLSNNQCVSCPSGTYLSGGLCLCKLMCYLPCVLICYS